MERGNRIGVGLSRWGARLGVLVVAACLAAFAVPAALADSIEIPAEADTFVSEGSPTTAHGDDQSFDVYGGVSSYGCGTGLSVGLLRFDVSAIPAGATVTGATLKLKSFTGFAYNGDPSHHAIYLADDSWSENATWSSGKPADGLVAALPEYLLNGQPLSASPDNLGAAGAFDNTSCGGTTSTDRDFSSSNLTSRLAAELAGDPFKKLSVEIFGLSCGGTFGGPCLPPGFELSYFLRYYSSEASIFDAPRLAVTYTPAPPATIFTVNSSADPGTGGCDVAECTLREAIVAANASANVASPDRIEFTGLGAGVDPITPATTLPDISDPVVIDGAATPPTIDGSALAPGSSGLHLAAGSDGSVIQNLDISGVPGTAIVVESSSNTVDGNELTGNGAGVLVTGAAPVAVEDPIVPNNVTVQNNTIATAFGLPASTAVAAVTVVNGSYVNVLDNTISGYDGAGLSATGTYRLLATGNAVGTNQAGTIDLGNTGDGVRLEDLSPLDPAGGVAQLSANIVAHNGGKGIVIVGATSRSSLSGNRIFANAGQSIDIGDDGPDGTSPGGPLLPNAGQNPVTLTSAVDAGGATHVSGEFISPGTHNYAIEIFAGSSGESPEAETWLGTGLFNTDGDGPQSFDISVGAAPPGSYITATITPETQTTSELSNAVLPSDGSLVTNGGFEQPAVSGVFATYSTGSASLTGWTVNGSIDHINGYWDASEGNQSLDLDGDAATGAISQTLATVPGQWYTISFQYTGNPDLSPDAAAGMDVRWGGSTVLHASHAPAPGYTSMNWGPGQVSVLATGTTTTLEFVSTDSPSSSSGIALDAVSVQVTEAGTFVVDSTADFGDETWGDGVCKTDVGSNCTLRAAIEEANASPNAGEPDRIEFAIPEGGAQTITPDSDLPAITDPVVIDGTTQSGYDTVPLIFLDGSAASCVECGVDGLFVGAGGSGSTIRGLAIGNFDGDGIELSGGDVGSVVESSWIGTLPPDQDYVGNEGSGVRITNSSGNTIGGPSAEQRVVLGANGGSSEAPSIVISGTSSSSNVVEGSYIGLAPDGSSSYDTNDGVLITDGASQNRIGGDSSEGEGNVVYGLYGTGVRVDRAGPGNIIAGNTIGSDLSGVTAEAPGIGIDVNDSPQTVIGANAGPGDLFFLNTDLGNVIVGSDSDAGISIRGTSSSTIVAGNAIGTDRSGTATTSGNGTGVYVTAGNNQIGPGNTVAYNDANGVEIDGEGATGNRIVANSIHHNGGKGIALANIANNGLDAPELGSAVLADGTTTVQGSISVPRSSVLSGTTYFVELFSSPSCDSSGSGEGASYIGFESVVAPFGEGMVALPFTGNVAAVGPGTVVTATVTSAGTQDTSEFSSCATVVTTAVDSVSIDAGVGSVEAPGRVPLANVPPAAFLSNTASSQRSAPVNDVPVNDILLRGSPVNDIPVNDVGLDALAPQLGDVLLSTVPLLRPGGWENALKDTVLAGRPLQNVTLQDVFVLDAQDQLDAGIATLNLGELDLSNSPLGKIPAFAWAVGEVPLSQLGIHGTTWCEVFAGPPVNCTTATHVEGRTLLSLGLSGAPVNDVPVNDIPVNDVPVNDIPVNDVPVNDIRVDGVPVNDVPINDVPVNDVPVNDIPVNDVPVNDVRVMDNPVNEVPVNDVPVNDVPINDVPVNEIPVNDVPVNEIPVNDVPVNEIPVNDIPVNEILLNGSPVNDIPVNDIANKTAIFTCVPSCPSSGTLGEHAAELKDGVTLLDLRLAHVGGDLPAGITLGDIGSWDTATVGDLVSALGGVDWSFLPPGTNPPSLAQIVGLVKQYAGTTPAAPTLGDLLALITLTRPSLTINLAYVTQTLYGNKASLAQMLALVLSSSDLGWERLDLEGLGVGRYADGAATVPYSVDVAVSGGDGGDENVTVRVTLPRGFSYVPGSSRLEQDEATPTVPEPTEAGGVLTWTLGIASPGSAQLRFSAYPGTVLGPASASANARAAGSPPVAAPDPATVDVTESFPAASTATPAAIASDAFYLTYISSSADGDVFSLPAPPIGSRVTIHLSHMPVDYDLVVYGPRGQVLVDPSPTAVPLDGQPLADPGAAPTHAIDELPADALNDVPIQAGATVVGISANRTNQQDDVTFVSAGTGTYLIQVSGFNGAVGIEPAMVRAEVLPPRVPATCTVRSFGNTASPASSLTTAVVPAGVNTVFVVNRQQLARVYGAPTADHAISTLTGFAVLGYPSAVLQVDSDPAVGAAYDGVAGWNDCPADPVRANAAAAAVGAVVRYFRSSHQTVTNVVLVGSDDVLPFARLDDRVTLSNESAYAGTFPADSALGGALGQAKMLSDDPYATLNPIPFFDRQLYVPELAIGRLIETPAQIEAQVVAFAAAAGSLDPTTAFTSGYSFLTDGAESVSSALTPVAGAPSPGGSNDTLISEVWTADELRTKLGTPASVLSINAHADHSRFQAANGTLLASDTLAPASTFDGRILFSMGCHAGLNVPDPFLAGTRGLGDWPQTFEGGGAAIFLGNTGFGYGDSDVVAYSEDLNRRFAEHLAEGLDAGQALTLAKQEFKSELGIVGVYDEKAMSELTLYGMPMYRIGRLSPLSAAASSAPASGAKTLSASAAGPGPSATQATANILTTSVDPVTGLTVEGFTVDQDFAGRRVDRSRGSFYRGRDGVYTTQLRPLEPKAVEPIASPNAHGALITELTSNDVSPFDPLFQRPTVDAASTEPELGYDEAAFPSKLQTVTTFERRSGRSHKLVLAQGQFFATDGADGAEGGVQRLFTHISGHVLTSADADYAPPLFRSVDAVKTGGFVTFTADVDAGTGDSVKRVLVLFLDGVSGAWTPLDLQLVGGRWSGAAESTAPTAQYFVQAVDEHGNVAVSTNKGFYYAGAAVPPQTGDVTITPDGTQASNGVFKGPVTLTTTAPPGVTVQISVDGSPFTTTLDPVTGDGTHVVKAKGSNGSSSTTAFVIDTTPPTVTITSGPADASSTQSTTATFEFIASEPGTFECDLDGGGFSSCTTGKAYTGLSEAQHVFHVRAVDAAENVGDPAAATWTVDTTKPVITMVFTPATTSVPRNATLKVTVTCTDAPPGSGLAVGSAGCSALLTKPDASTMNIGTGALSPPLPTGVEGTYTLSATSTDKAGNTRTSQTTYTVGTSAIGTIVFARGGDIWSIKPDGTDLRQITSGAPIDEQPTKTPSGDRIVFARGPVGSRQLYSIDPDGQNLVGPLTSGGDNTAPAFSPDGTKLAFESTRTGSKDRDIWTAVYTTTGTSLASYFNASNAKGSDVTPAWSPSGTKIAFASNRPEKFEIFTMLATGGKQVQLTRNKKNDVDPSYLPDGRITFSSNQSKGGPANKQEIFVMHADGTSQLRLTKIMGFDRAPLYFDAANGIVFQSATFGGGGLAKVAPAGGTVTKIPNTIPNDATPG